MVSDATLVVSVPSHLDVAVFSKLYTPAVFDEPEVLSFLSAVTHNQHAMVHFLGTRIVHVHATMVEAKLWPGSINCNSDGPHKSHCLLQSKLIPSW